MSSEICPIMVVFRLDGSYFNPDLDYFHNFHQRLVAISPNYYSWMQILTEHDRSLQGDMLYYIDRIIKTSVHYFEKKFPGEKKCICQNLERSIPIFSYKNKSMTSISRNIKFCVRN